MKINGKKLICLTTCTLLFLTGCGGQKSQKPADSLKPLAKEDVVSSMDFSQSEEISEDFGKEQNLLAFDLYERLDHTANLFFSPYSIASALSMLENSAGGQTKDELDSLLYISDSAERNSDMKLFAESFKDPDAVLNTANSLWISIHLDIKDDAEETYFAPMKYYYNADVYQSDFTKDETQNAINNWISERTDHMLPNMLSELDPATKMCLINAVYFKGEWAQKFYPEDTYKQKFYGTNQANEVDIMHQYKSFFPYMETEGLKGIRLFYGEGGIAMDVWMSMSENETADDIFCSLSAEEKCELMDSLDHAAYEEISTLALPKFTVEGETISLNEVLLSLGMEESFKEDADFDIINDDLFVTDVLHQAKIEVEECGTKAAAATVIMDTEACAETVSPAPSYDFIADHPFIYCIRDVSTGAILFMGVVNNL